MNLKNHIPADVQELARLLGKDNVRIAGGAVRDILLGQTPKDFDLATRLLPQDVMLTLRDHGLTVLETGLQHGTVTAVLNGEPYEITTLRVDISTDGRHAEVAFTDNWLLDAERRDLTINAMFLDMDGNVHDYFGGQEDLDDGHVRFVGDAEERIEEDYLRILRFFRFCGRLGRGADYSTLDVIASTVNGLAGISGERVWAEMQQILRIQSHAVLYDLLQDMEETRVLAAIGLHRLTPDGFELARIANKMNAEAITVLAGLLDGNPAMARILFEDWKLSRKEFDALGFISRMIQVHGNDLMDLDFEWFQRQIVRVNVNREHMNEFVLFTEDPTLIADVRAWKAPEFPVRGQDLLDLGIKPGPEVGDKLRELRELWEQSDCKVTRDVLLQNL